MTSMADVVSSAENARMQAEQEKRREEEMARKAVYDARARRISIVQLAAQIPLQGGGFWQLVKQIENYIEHGQPTEIVSDVSQ